LEEFVPAGRCVLQIIGWSKGLWTERPHAKGRCFSGFEYRSRLRTNRQRVCMSSCQSPEVPLLNYEHRLTSSKKPNASIECCTQSPNHEPITNL